MKAIRLALDFSITSPLFPLFNELDAIVLDYRGCRYLKKDKRISRAVFDRGYGTTFDMFREIKAKWDPTNKFSSLHSVRLGIGV